MPPSMQAKYTVLRKRNAQLVCERNTPFYARDRNQVFLGTPNIFLGDFCVVNAQEKKMAHLTPILDLCIPVNG